jgi:hypothetical protein
MHQPIPVQGKWLWHVINGYFNYMQYRPTAVHCTCSGTTSSITGGARCGDGARRIG